MRQGRPRDAFSRITTAQTTTHRLRGGGRSPRTLRALPFLSTARDGRAGRACIRLHIAYCIHTPIAHCTRCTRHTPAHVHGCRALRHDPPDIISMLRRSLSAPKHGRHSTHSRAARRGHCLHWLAAWINGRCPASKLAVAAVQGSASLDVTANIVAAANCPKRAGDQTRTATR